MLEGQAGSSKSSEESQAGLDRSVARVSKQKLRDIFGTKDAAQNSHSKAKTDFDYKVDSPPKVGVAEKYESPLK